MNKAEYDLMKQIMELSIDASKYKAERDQLKERVEFLEKLLLSMEWARNTDQRITGSFSHIPSAI